MARLLQGLKTDFRDDEVLRQMLLNRAPKYGNNDPKPTNWAGRYLITGAKKH